MPIPNGTIIVGGQFGSEGKGAVIHEIGNDYETHVRVGGPQAGHSIKLWPGTPEERVLKLQTIPVGVAHGKCGIIAMTSVLDPEVLEREIGWFDELGLPVDLIIDPRATILWPSYREGEADAGLTDKLGSTGKGVGFARAERIMRRAMTVGEYISDVGPRWADRVRILETDRMLWSRLITPGHGVLVEAAQGIGLSLYSSGHYPYVTSAEATPTQSFADTGLPLGAAALFESIGVFRTYPIRVAGNSGPLPNETTWEAIEKKRGAPISDSEKTTTVTRKIRRVGEWDAEMARKSVHRHGLNAAFLTFVDYVYPEVEGETAWGRIPPNVKRYVAQKEKELGCPILAIGTGFGTYAWRDQ